VRILHVTRADVWADVLASGATSVGAPRLASDGFVHCCTDAQLPAVLGRFHSDISNLVALVLETALLHPEVKWEPPLHPDGSPNTTDEDAMRFPHVYGPINVGAVVAVRELS
jgi:uncharacterized protein (DUF952 family)